MSALGLALLTLAGLVAATAPAPARQDSSAAEMLSHRPAPGIGMAASPRKPKPYATQTRSPVWPHHLNPTEPTDNYMNTQPGDPDAPVRWDPCRVIHWVLNPANEPKGARRLLKDAFEQASAVTGFTFEYDGLTTETNGQFPNRTYLPQLYGDRWSPVLVTWEKHLPEYEENREFLGYAGPLAVTRSNGEQVYVSGTLQLHARSFGNWMVYGSGSKYDLEVPLILHEIGHVLGLGHSPSNADLMYPRIGKQLTYRSADLAGLRELASGPCVPDI